MHERVKEIGCLILIYYFTDYSIVRVVGFIENSLQNAEFRNFLVM